MSAKATEEFVRGMLAKGKSLRFIVSASGWTEAEIRRLDDEDAEQAPAPTPAPVAASADDLLRKGLAHPSKRIRNAAVKAKAALEAVAALVAADAGKAQARERVARLERELREAKAALRGSAAPTANVTALDSKAVRAWARDNGVECPAVGRVPQPVVEAYNAAHAQAS